MKYLFIFSLFVVGCQTKPTTINAPMQPTQQRVVVLLKPTYCIVPDPKPVIEPPVKTWGYDKPLNDMSLDTECSCSQGDPLCSCL